MAQLNNLLVTGAARFLNVINGTITNSEKVNNHTVNSDVPANAVFTDTKNTTGSTDTSSKIFLVGATSQAANPQTYSHDTAYVGTDGCLYSGGTKVLTAHQDISGKADKSATVSTVTYDSTNKKLTKTINGTASDIVSVATLKTALSLVKGDVGLGNVENKSSATIRGELTKANVTNALGYTPPTSDTNTHRPIQVNGTEVLGNNTTALNLKAGSNVSVTNSSGTVTIAATDTTYSSKTAASGGTDVSLVTTGEKYTWNSKTSNTGTVTKVSTGIGLTGGDITSSGTVKAKLRSETALTIDSAAGTTTTGRVYPVAVDKSGYLSVNVPWTDTNTQTLTGVKGNAETTYRTGNVNLTPANIGAAAASHTHSADNIVGGYLNIHPENNPTVIPFIHNDIAFLLKRGGSAVVKYDNTVQNVDISNVFDGSGSYCGINPTGVTTITIELTLHTTFTWPNIIYADFGADSWRSKTVKIEVMNTNYSGDTWTQKYSTTTNTVGHVYVATSHTPVGASNAGGGFNKIRFTFSNWGNATNFRISQLGVCNYGSIGVRQTYMSRGIDDYIFRNITPNSSSTYSLGDSSHKWKNIYVDTLNGTTIPTSPKFTDTTYESKAAASGGTAVSLVTTGEKYTWNNKSNLTIGTTASTAAAGNHNHDSTYLKLTGGTLTGAINTANGTLNNIGDDVMIGDQNIAGTLAIKGKNGATGIQLIPYSGSTANKISNDGAGNLTITGTTVGTFKGNLTGTASSVSNSLTLKLKSGTTEGTDLYTFNGSAAKTLDIKQGSNITLTAAAGSLTIAATQPKVSIASSAPSSASSGDIWFKLS